MEYKEAIKIVLTKHGKDILSSPFKLRCILSDYVANDLRGKRLVDIIYHIYPYVDLLQLFTNFTLLEGRNQLNSLYKKSFRNDILAKDFVDAINPISEFLRPEEFQSNNNSKPNQGNATVVHVVKKRNTSSTPGAKVIPTTPVNNIIPKAPRKPKQRKRTTIDNADAFILDIEAKEINIRYTIGDQVKVFIDGVLHSSAMKGGYVVSGIVAKDLDFKNHEVTIALPKREYIALTLNLHCDKAVIGLDKANPIECETLTIHQEKGLLEVYGKGEHLDLELGDVEAILNVSFDHVIGTQNSGDLDLDYRIGDCFSTEVKYWNRYGNIYVTFFDDDLFSQSLEQTHLKEFKYSKNLYGTPYDINIKSYYGRIDVKFFEENTSISV